MIKSKKGSSKIEVTDSEAHISDQSDSSTECAYSDKDEIGSGSLDSVKVVRTFDDNGYLAPRRRDNSLSCLSDNTMRPLRA